MVNNVYKFRRVKWGNPREKLKVLVEDIQRTRKVWLDRLTPGHFGALVGAAARLRRYHDGRCLRQSLVGLGTD